ncbi:MAG: hypothetical protein ABIQ12_04785 [Opitutaceae bacterium]
MNRNSDDPRHPWMRLNAAARAVRDPRDTAAPFGFATRIVALAHEHGMVSLLERISLRALGVACLLAIASVAANYQALLPGSGAPIPAHGIHEEFDASPVRDAVTVVLDLAD